MSLKKFGENDIILNTMRTYPKSEFFIFDSNIYYNDKPSQSGAFSAQADNVPSGHISLHEINTDRADGTNPFIYPFTYKQSSGFALSGSKTTDAYGTVISGSYPLSASITREFMATAGQRNTATNPDTGLTFQTTPVYPHFYALKNRLNFYGAISEHYKVSSSYGDKANQTINLTSIPSIFYGQKINPGSVRLDWYFTGSLIGTLEDTKQNGELIQTGPVGSTGSGSVAGVVLYNEGFILLTGSWALSSQTISLEAGAGPKNPSWIYWGAGAHDNVSTATAGASYLTASSRLSFEGTNDIQVMTMFAHARRGEVNYSNNPTYIEYNQSLVEQTSSQIYLENNSRRIYNFASSSYTDYSASFERQVYVSRVAIYDDKQNLIGVATLSNPVRKKEDEDLTFKLKLDI